MKVVLRGSPLEDCQREEILAEQVTKAGSLTGLSHGGRALPPIYA